MTHAVRADAVLDLVPLTAVPADEWRIGERELRYVRESATGRRREVLLASAAGQPLTRRLRTFALAWEHVGAMRGTLEELLAVPGEHSLVLWRDEYLTWRGDGVTRELALPAGWRLAVDVLAGALPSGVTTAAIAPAVKIGRTGAVLTWSLQDVATFDGGAPPAGEVWSAAGEGRVKLGDVPPLDAIVHGRVVPVYPVFVAAERPEKRFDAPLREPLDVTLLEAG